MTPSKVNLSAILLACKCIINKDCAVRIMKLVGYINTNLP